MNEEDIHKGIEILQDIIKDNRVYSKQFIVGESELIATLNALHKAIDIEKELQQEKEKNKKLEEGIRQIKDKLEIADYYNCQDGADELTRLLQES